MILWRTVDPTKLRPQFRADVEGLLHVSPYTWVATHGLRTLEEQDKLHQIALAGGPRAAPAGMSPHNFGLAIDVCLDGAPAPGLQPDWELSHPGWLWLFNAVYAHPRLHNGRDFGDADHIEALGWKNLITKDVAA